MKRPIMVFYVYTETDEELRQLLEKHLALLQRQGVLTSWHESQAGAVWEQEWEQAFKEASLILLLVSADFLASDVCYKEQMQRALERQKEGEVQVLPILIRPVEITNAPFTHLPIVPTNGQAVTLWSNQDAAWTHITEGIRCVLEGKPLPVVQERKEAAKYTAENQQASYEQTIGEHNEIHQHYYLSTSPPPVSLVTSVKPVWMVPYTRNPFFTGRDAVLSDLHQRFKQGQAQAVSQPQAMSGLGGIGKTQIAVEYAYRYRAEYQQVLWASAETEELLTSAYARVATKLDLPEKEAKDQEIIVAAVKQWLEEHQQWLLILDNADEPEVLEPFLPSVVGGHVLVTTRASDLATLGLGFGHALEIETFTPEQGGLFLLHRVELLALDSILDQAREEDRQHAMELSEELGGLPLALDQAGSYIAKARCTLESYQQLYQTHRKQLLKERRGKEHPNPVATTWQLSFKRIEATNPSAVELLRMLAFLSPDAIPEEILTEDASLLLGLVLAPVVADAFLFNRAIEALLAYSLVRRDSQGKTLSIHRLMQVVLQDEMEEAQEHCWIERAILVVNAAFPTSEPGTWMQCERLLSQALTCITLIEQRNLLLLEGASLCNRVGNYLHNRARYSEAELLYQRALAIYEQQLGPDHLETATSLHNLAFLYDHQSRYRLAEPFFRHALTIYELQVVPAPLQIVACLNNLARCYKNQEKYEQAESLCQRALDICKQLLTPDHPDIAPVLNNLAGLYERQGAYEQAEPLYRRALIIYERQLDHNHPEIATALNNLAGLYGRQNAYEQAEPLYQRALIIYERLLGPDHPHTMTCLNNWALVYYSDQGNYEQAESLYQRALASYEQRLGSEHPETATCLYNLAFLYYNQGKYEQAEPLYQRALAIYKQHLGPEHLCTATCVHSLGVLYRVQEKREQAEKLLRDALAIYEKQMDDEHPSIASSLNNLALLYVSEGKYEQAKPLYQRAWMIRVRRLGSHHPYTRAVHKNYTALLRAMGLETEALQAEMGHQDIL